MLYKQKISEQFIQNWKKRIDNSSRAYLYKHIKNFTYQPYFDVVNISKFRIVCINYVCFHIDCILKLEDGIGLTKHLFLKEYVMFVHNFRR